MSFDNAYQSLVDEHSGGDARWAYGSGFDDDMSDVDRSIPSTVDSKAFGGYLVMLGDDALIMAQRTAQWCSRAPELEEDVALANIALDLLGQSRLLLTRAAEVDQGVLPAAAPAGLPDEDALAYFRDETQFRNVRLVEIDNGDFGATIARLLLFSCWRLAQFSRLASSRDPVLAAIAAKAVNELAYHRDHAAQWTVRLGDGTAESHRRMQAGLDRAWPFLDELFAVHPVERTLAAAGVAVEPDSLRSEVDDVLDQVLVAATLTRPATPRLAEVGGRAGRDGVHTEVMGYLLAEMQHLARSHPDAVW